METFFFNCQEILLASKCVICIDLEGKISEAKVTIF